MVGPTVIFQVLIEVKPESVQWSTPVPSKQAFQLLGKYFEPNYAYMKKSNLAFGAGYEIDFEKTYSMLEYLVSIN